MPLNPRWTARACALPVLALLCVTATPVSAFAAEPPEAPESVASASSEPAPETAPPPPAVARAAAPPVSAAAAPAPDDPCHPGACIDNGTVRLGVNPDGSLLVESEDEDAETENGNLVGLQHVPTGHDATRSGSPYEGWGVGDAGTAVGGGTVTGGRENNGPTNITVESFDVTESTATSVVTVGDPSDPAFRVTHAFTPSVLSPNVYVVRVRIQNLTDGTLEDVRYRRVIDWDVEPTDQSEIIDIVDEDVAVVETRTDGFNEPNPLVPNESGTTGDVSGLGPNDLGVTFDLALGSLAPGEFVEFFLFFGAAATEAEALDALETVGAGSYSTARPSDQLVDDGSPSTFFFGFSTDPEVAPEPEPEPDPQPAPEPGPQTGTPEEDAAENDLEPVTAHPAATTQRVLSADAQLPAAGAPVGAETAVLGAVMLVAGAVALGAGRRRDSAR